MLLEHKAFVQEHNYYEKPFDLTQLQILQRVFQKLILVLAAILQVMRSLNLYVSDISQAHVQSTPHLNRDSYIKTLIELL